MATEDFAVTGLRELEKALLDLEPAVGVKVLRAAGREAMKPVLEAATQDAHEDTGDLKAAMAISATKGKGNTAVNINVGPTRTKATKKQGGRKFTHVNQKAIAQEFGTRKQKADPFLVPALQRNAERVLVTFGRSLGNRIEKAARKVKK